MSESQYAEYQASRGRVRIPVDDARCQVGTQRDFFEACYQGLARNIPSHIWMEPGSVAHRMSATPVDTSRIPGPHDWVPVTCAWSAYPYPGPLERSQPAASIDHAARIVGGIQGRPMAEVQEVFGEPDQVILDSGGAIATWNRPGLRKRSIVQFFDTFNVGVGDLEWMLASATGPSRHRVRRTLRESVRRRRAA